MKTETARKRYASHLPLAAIGSQGQARIGRARAALIGLGGLGCAAAQYLVSSGIGHLTLCDFDTVAESNLARQVLYRATDLGNAKVAVASEVLQTINPNVELVSMRQRMNDQSLQALLPDCDFVIDASDNYGTRLAVNRSCLANKVPWLMASCVRMEGQLMLLRPDLPGQACYRCAYGQAPDTLEDCPGAGIFAPVAGIVGTSAAHFALAHIAGLTMPTGLHLFDAVHWSWQSLGIRQDSACQDCSSQKT